MSVPDTLHRLLRQCQSAARAGCAPALAARLDAAVTRFQDAAAADDLIAALHDVQAALGVAAPGNDAPPVRECLLGIAAWMLEHGFRVHELAPLVDALAGAANSLRDPAVLGQLARLAGQLLEASDDGIKHDPGRTNPGHPLFVLQINRAILATRSLEPAAIESAYDALVRALPEAAPGFFSQAMREMVRLDYPPRVRAVVERYYDALTRGLRQ